MAAPLYANATKRGRRKEWEIAAFWTPQLVLRSHEGKHVFWGGNVYGTSLTPPSNGGNQWWMWIVKQWLLKIEIRSKHSMRRPEHQYRAPHSLLVCFFRKGKVTESFGAIFVCFSCCFFLGGFKFQGLMATKEFISDANGVCFASIMNG